MSQSRMLKSAGDNKPPTQVTTPYMNRDQDILPVYENMPRSRGTAMSSGMPD